MPGRRLARPGSPSALLSAIKLKSPPFSRPIRFILTGVLNTLFSFCVFEALLAVTRHAPASLVASYVLGAMFNYFSIGRFVFYDHPNPSLFRFGVGYAVVLAANLLAQHALRRFGVEPAWSQACLLPLIACLAYTINRMMVYKLSRPRI